MARVVRLHRVSTPSPSLGPARPVYRACLFCVEDLGSNEVLPTFPVGRRLAFDPKRGRLWVVCTKCERWNLTPLEERWEAIDECERRFRSTHLRVSTDNIGLTRLKEGLELVRIGEPLRPEFASWRYGDQFGHRRARALAGGAALAAAGTAIAVGSLSIGIGVIAAFELPHALEYVWKRVYRERRVAWVPTGDGLHLSVRRKHLDALELLGDGAGAWTLKLPHDGGEMQLGGDVALRAAGLLLPRVNATGASARQVQHAVRLLDEAGDPLQVFANAARRLPHTRRVIAGEVFHGKRSHYGAVERLLPSHRLALEMAAHEEIERRALLGELSMLEVAWRQAEEIAVIADDLLPPTLEEVRALRVDT